MVWKTTVNTQGRRLFLATLAWFLLSKLWTLLDYVLGNGFFAGVGTVCTAMLLLLPAEILASPGCCRVFRDIWTSFFVIYIPAVLAAVQLLTLYLVISGVAYGCYQGLKAADRAPFDKKDVHDAAVTMWTVASALVLP